MSADPIIYCLENLTDYSQFERLSSDLMSGSDYKNIEPIGGSNDLGRDAIHVSRADAKFTVFAYTVRSDWATKLKQDCDRIVEVGHSPDAMVFVCTSNITAKQRDDAIRNAEVNYGWPLEIFDIERIRVLLTGNLRHLVARHPSIFTPPWFPVKGGLSIAECRDTIVIEHTEKDHYLATWLSNKLSVSGYRTWCYGISPMAGEYKNDTLNALLENRAIQYLPILCGELLAEVDCLARIGLSMRSNDFIVPCWSENLRPLEIDAKILGLTPAVFYESWSVGLKSIFEQLNARHIPVELDPARGKSIALAAYMPEPLTKPVIEKIYSNVFPVMVPASLFRIELSSAISDSDVESIRKHWAFSKISSSVVIAFDLPPKLNEVSTTLEYAEYSWQDLPNREGIKSENAVKELVRRSMFLACNNAGLIYCENTNGHYFKEKNSSQQHNIGFSHVDGRKTRVAVTGTGTSGWGDRAVKFRYQLSPRFIVEIDDDKRCWVRTNIYVRVTDSDGKLYEGKEINRKRKKITKSWWNKQWLARTLGVMQALATTEEQQTIKIGSSDKRSVQVSTFPLHWECPVSIDIDAVERIGDFQQEIANSRTSKDDDVEELIIDGEEPK